MKRSDLYFWDLWEVINRLHLLYCVVHGDCQSTLLFVRWYRNQITIKVKLFYFYYLGGHSSLLIKRPFRRHSCTVFLRWLTRGHPRTLHETTLILLGTSNRVERGGSVVSQADPGWGWHVFYLYLKVMPLVIWVDFSLINCQYAQFRATEQHISHLLN